jgi:D-glycero-D-manno-heptose 1,7-bisphosphate phosphatase
VINRPIVRDGKPYPPQSLDEFELLRERTKPVKCSKRPDFCWWLPPTSRMSVGENSNERSWRQSTLQMLEQLPIDRVMVCYHGGERVGDPCDCRKPRPGMLLDAAKELRISLSGSFMIGDRWRDIECGAPAGCQQ